jgi:hypothetical protein
MHEPATFLAPRAIRWGTWVAAACGLLLTGSAVTDLSSGNRLTSSWFFLAIGPLQVAYYVWLASLARRPIVHITDREVMIRPIHDRAPAVVERNELVGLRWQDSFDLRLRLRSGSELSIHMKQIARHDRARLHHLLQEIVARA